MYFFRNLLTFFNSLKNRISIKQKVFEGKDKVIKIDELSVVLPAFHTIDNFKKSYPRYDLPLGELAQCLANKYPAMVAIDIGANVGTSAVLVFSKTRGEVLCIEGDLQSLPYLRRNLDLLGNKATLVECFVGDDTNFIDVSKVDRTAKSSASFVGAITNDSTAIRLKNLTSLTQEYPSFKKSKLVKIDTDGFDFDIINQSIILFAEMRPVLFFEYDPNFLSQGSLLLPLSTIKNLVRIGYKAFVVFDNFGNFLLSTDRWQDFFDLTLYLKRNMQHNKRVYYYDVAAFHRDDIDIFTAFVKQQRELILLENDFVEYQKTYDEMYSNE